MVAVLPLPVMPSSVWYRRPSSTPWASWAIALGWSPAGWNGDSTKNLSTSYSLVAKRDVQFGVEIVEGPFVPQHAVNDRCAFVVAHLIGQPGERVNFAKTSPVDQSSNRGLGRYLHRPHGVDGEGCAMLGTKERDRTKDRVAVRRGEALRDLDTDRSVRDRIQPAQRRMVMEDDFGDERPIE